VAQAAWIQADPEPFDVSATHAFITRIAAARFDEAVIFTSFHQSPLPMALLLRMAGVPRISAISVDYGGALLDVRHRVDDGIHEVERALSLAAAAGYPQPADDDAHLAMTVGVHNPISAVRPYVVVHPGATVRARAWAPERNAELVAALGAQGTPVVVTGGAGERDLCAYVAGEAAHNLCGRTDFTTLGRVIADAQAIVVGNTGAAHVAAAVGTPVVSLFAPTIPAARFRPWLVPHVLLGKQDIPCAGCRARECPLPHQRCLDAVDVEDVLAALATLLPRACSCAS
jgi:ADP-heptose:LPS heptosyltransferase